MNRVLLQENMTELTTRETFNNGSDDDEYMEANETAEIIREIDELEQEKEVALEKEQQQREKDTFPNILGRKLGLTRTHQLLRQQTLSSLSFLKFKKDNNARIQQHDHNKMETEPPLLSTSFSNSNSNFNANSNTTPPLIPQQFQQLPHTPHHQPPHHHQYWQLTTAPPHQKDIADNYFSHHSK